VAEPTPPQLGDDTRHAHECLQRALLGTGGRYALPNPYPNGWQVGPLGIEIHAGEPPEPRLWLLAPWDVGPSEPPIRVFAQIVNTLAPAQRAQTILALTVNELPPPPLLDALERSLGIPVVACTSREHNAGPRAEADGTAQRLKALLQVDNARLSAVDPATAWTEAKQSVAQAAETYGFFQRLREITPRVYVTPAVLGICVAVWLIQLLSGLSPTNPTAMELQRWGANAAMVTLEGQPWRLLTAGFLHGGIIHLGINMWVLRDVGPVCERLFGNLPYLAVYLIAVLGGGLASLAWHPEIVASVGASGGIFGLGGAILGCMLARRHAVPDSVFLRFRNSLGAFVVYNLIFGFAISAAPVGIKVDNAGHLGGLAAGFVAGFLLSRPLPPGPTAWKRLLWLPVLLAGLGGAFAVVQTSPRIRAEASDMRSQLGSLESLQALQDVWLGRIDQEWADLLAGLEGSDPDAALERFVAQHAETRAGIATLELTGPFAPLKAALLGLLDARAPLAKALRDGSPELEALGAAHDAAMDELEKAYEGL
jgi:membrane associated rhomboid family serine protease